MRAALGLFTLAILSLSGCQRGSSGTCATSRDCALGEVCLSGSCTPNISTKCMTDQNCDFGQVCIDSACVEMPAPTSCTDDSMCASNQRCNTLTGVCIDRVTNTPCTTNSECASNEMCSNGSCVPLNTTGVCSTDTECNPPSEICISGACVLGCGQPNGAMCGAGEVCDTNNGRCVSIRGPCSLDPDCNPPTEVCESGQCIPGCTQVGGVQCPGGQQCNPSTGRCTAVGDICLSDLDCSSPAEICNLVSGACDPGCASSGCTAPDTCDQASGHCAGTRTCMPDRYEPNDSFGQGSPAGGLQTQLTICGGDVDFHRFTLGAGDPATITVDYVYGEGNVDIELVDANGAVVAMSNTTGNNETIQYTAAAAGDYAVRVFLQRDLGPTPGNTYSIRVDSQVAPCGDDNFEDNDSPLLPPLITAGTTQGVNVCDGDDDYFNVYLEANEEITVNVRFSNAEGDIDIALLDFILPVATSGGVGDVETVTYTAAEAGFFAVQVSLYSDQGSMPGNTYTIEVIINQGTPQTCAVDALEENDSRGAARTIAAGQTQNLNTCTGDEDFYAIQLAANDQISATASFGTGEGDIDLELVDSAGTVLDSATTTGGSENVSATVTTAGTYYLRVFLYGDAGSTVGNTYSLDVQVTGSNPNQCIVDPFEPNDSLGGAPSTTMGSYTNLGQCGDDDYFAITLTSGDTINIDVSFTHSEGDVDIELYGPNGSVAASSETTTNNENVGGTANVSGTFTLRVFLYQDSGGTPGNTYQLSISP